MRHSHPQSGTLVSCVQVLATVTSARVSFGVPFTSAELHLVSFEQVPATDFSLGRSFVWQGYIGGI